MADRTFTDGYLDGWRSMKPGTIPGVPAYAIPAGKTPYQHGYDLGRAAASVTKPNSN